jgi:pilus assembly protein CpaB
MQVTVVTLVVTPDQAERLTLASTEGKIQLALRNPLDLESPETSGVKPGMLMGTAQQRPARAARRAVSPASTSAPALVQPAPTVEIIRGDKRQHVTVG